MQCGPHLAPCLRALGLLGHLPPLQAGESCVLPCPIGLCSGWLPPAPQRGKLCPLLSLDLASAFASLPAASSLLYRFLDEVQSHSNVNKMSVQNLATVFGPNILRPQIEDPVTIMEGNGGGVHGSTGCCLGLASPQSQARPQKHHPTSVQPRPGR